MASVGLFNTIPEDQLGFFANQTLQAGQVAEFLDFSKRDIAQVASVPVNSVRYDDKIPRQVREHIEQIAIICGLVALFFKGDKLKTALWMRTRNPLLGEITPREMIRYGRMKKLQRIVQDALDANGLPAAHVTVMLTEAANVASGKKVANVASGKKAATAAH